MSSVISLWKENLFLTRHLSGRVLDIGCGNGDYSKMLLELPNVTEVIAADILPPSSYFQGKMYKSNAGNCNYVQCDIEALPFDERMFDSIFCWRVMQYARDGLRTLMEMCRVLSGDPMIGGLLMIRMPIDPHGKPKDSVFRNELSRQRADAFTWRTFWDEAGLERNARLAGLESVTATYIDKSNSQVRLFRRAA